ncbi:Uu.00g123910.m01.CDS01 [Anthostomella pinea]|uniref:Dynactin subunit 6 n=1 Tax=Anthostomella pinea TaxID=933095 RepID=A0AAI8YHP1_9PEZI|nr:Uu.00g123910.m01.CDS01 [Anthostomella pinea]
MSSSNKRQSVLPRMPAGPKAPVNFSSSITIADSALLAGKHTINIGSESVVHPRARLDSALGRITIGRRCVVHERTSLGAAPASAPASDPTILNTQGGVTIGDYATLEVGAVVEAGGTVVGEGCVVGIGCRIGSGAKLGKHCTLTPLSEIQPGEEVPDFTVVYSNGTRRLDRRGITELKHKAQARQIEVLKRLIPSNPTKFQ